MHPLNMPSILDFGFIVLILFLAYQSIVCDPFHVRRASMKPFGVYNSIMMRILHQDLQFHLHKLIMVKALYAFLENIPNDAIVFFSDEAHFHIFACVYKKNMCYWCNQNPRELIR